MSAKWPTLPIGTSPDDATRRRSMPAISEGSIHEAVATPPAEAADLLTTRETADQLRLSVSTLERMRLDGTGPNFIKLGKGRRARVVYRRADIESWARAQTFSSTSQYRK